MPVPDVSANISARGRAGARRSEDGSDDYGDVTIGNTIETLDSATVVAYFTWNAGSSTWARVFDFGRSQFGADPFFAGSIHEVLIYGEALSADRILDICTRGPVMWMDDFESGDTSMWDATTR